MSFRRLSRNALASVTQTVLGACVLFEFYRFLMRHLEVEEIGVWSLVMASTAIARLSDCGLGGGVVKFVAGDLGAKQGARAARTIGMATVTIAGVTGLACLLAHPILRTVLSAFINDPTMRIAALHLLPYALGALWLVVLGNIFLGALDGCQRTDLRALVMVGAAIGQLVAAYLIVPQQGLLALGLVQLVQSALMLFASACLVGLILSQPARVWFSWDQLRFGKLIRYGAGFQLAALGQLLFEPMVKGLLTVFGGLSLTGYYEMANRAVTQFRAVIVSGYQMLVPYVAAKARGDSLSPASLRNKYLHSYRLLLVLVAPYYALIGGALPILLTLWLGAFDRQFVVVGVLCLVGWALNTLSVPAYFLYLAIGRLRWVIWTQVAIGVLNVSLASVGGWIWGGLGVLGGAVIALVCGSLLVMIAFHREYDVSLLEIIPRSSLPLIMTCLVGVTGLLWLGFSWHGQNYIPFYLIGGISVLAMVTAMLAWSHPIRTELSRRLYQDAP